MAKTITYYFAPHSPWAFLGHARLLDIARRHGAEIDLRPVDAGRMFSVSGGLPLAKRPPQRQAYRLVELARWAKHLNVPLIVQPSVFPLVPDLAAKTIIVTQLAHGTEAALKLTGAIGAALWTQDRNIADEAVLVGIANEQDLDGAQLLKAADTPAAQSQYDTNTDQAIAANVFGVPWYVVDDEAFWGQDRLDFVERALSP